MESNDKVEDNRPIAGGVIVAPDKRRRDLSGKKFVFTSAQNNTYIHEGFYSSLLHFCEENGAQLIISPFTYNKSGFQNGTRESDDLWYDPRIEEFFVSETCNVAPGLIFCGELDILPTAVNPLSGLESYAQNNSAIIPHTKVQLQSMPRMKGEDPRSLFTTGTITQRNYIQRKAGQKAEFHHVFGALLVEVDAEGLWFARQLIASEDGVFYDLTTKYSPEGVDYGHRVEAITWGDIHHEKLDHNISNVNWMRESCILDTLQPKHQFIHDLTDFRARNHHNIRDPYHRAAMYAKHGEDVQHDMEQCGLFLCLISRPWCNTVVVESNHDQALQRWLRDANVNQDPINAVFFHEANTEIYRAIRDNVSFNVFEWAVRKSGYDLENVLFLNEDDSYLVHGIECGMHGHRGPNGSRATPKSFRFIGRKVNTAHTHSAGIFEGVYTAGVSGLLDMGYNKGPSSWSHSHIVTYPNGKRTIITLRNEKWKA